MFRVFVFLCVFVTSSEGAPGDRIIAKLSDGVISGIEGVTTFRSIPFWRFLGIPYAAPPIGNLRFRAPEPVEPWSGVRDASYHRSICMQADEPDTSEDCLFVNVYTTKQPGTESPLLPVMVWIHGGAFYYGSGNLDANGADLFLENGVVLVSLNYRLGAFGFFCTMDEASPGNYALKDQIAALRWVQNNIAIFGGDPNRVTIFGHSAGSASVVYLLQTPLSKGLYHAAIAQSGSSLDPWSVAPDPWFLAFRVGAKNSIFTRNSTLLVSRLRQVSADRLLHTAFKQAKDMRDNKNGLPWSVCIENDRAGAVVTTYSHVLLSTGNFNRIPFMTGFASLEVRDTTKFKWLVAIYSMEYALFPSTMVSNDMNAVDKYAAGEEIKHYYFYDTPIGNNTNFVKYASDNLFVRGINKHVVLMSKYAPVYYYRFAFTGGSQHRKFEPEGASHGEEMQFLLEIDKKQTTAEAELTQTRMIKMWTNFAKYHNPTPKKDPDLSYLIWNATNGPDGRMTYLDIDTDLSIREDAEKEQMKFWDDLYNKYGFQPYNTY